MKRVLKVVSGVLEVIGWLVVAIITFKLLVMWEWWYFPDFLLAFVIVGTIRNLRSQPQWIYTLAAMFLVFHSTDYSPIKFTPDAAELLFVAGLWIWLLALISTLIRLFREMGKEPGQLERSSA